MASLSDLLRKFMESSLVQSCPASKQPAPPSVDEILGSLLKRPQAQDELASELCVQISDAITPSDFLQRFGINCFYHFTDTRNLPSIQARGGLLPWSQIKGDVVAPGGNNWSHDADAIKGQDNYVHLCFLPEHPMEFVAKKDGRILDSRFLRIDSSVIHTPGILFCSDVANKSGVEMLDLATAVATMDFEIIAPAHKWLDPSLFERKKRACKYELLVPGQVPLSLISGI